MQRSRRCCRNTSLAPSSHSQFTGMWPSESSGDPRCSLFVGQHLPRWQPPNRRRTCHTHQQKITTQSDCDAPPSARLKGHPRPDGPLSHSPNISTRLHRLRLVRLSFGPHRCLRCSSIHAHLHDDALPGGRKASAPVASIVGRRTEKLREHDRHHKSAGNRIDGSADTAACNTIPI